MIKHKDQRVGVFIDVANMYHSAKNLYRSRVNFKEILKTAVGNRKLVRAIAYVVKSNNVEEETFFEALNCQGFEVKMKDLQIFAGGVKKADWDVGISVDIITLAPKLDVVVLVTGDGDYIPLVEYLKYHGHLVEIIAFKETASSALQQICDDFVDLSDNKKSYLIKKQIRNV